MEDQDSASIFNDQTAPLSSTSLGSLNILPPEIRDKIYSLVFFAGHMCLRRASKALHKDTEDALLLHGIYRLNIRYWVGSDRYSWSVTHRIPTSVLAKVQNLQINILFAFPASPREEENRPRGDLDDDHIHYHYKATWTLKSDSSTSLLPDSKDMDFQNYGLWTLWTPSLKILLQKVTGTMNRHSYCEIIHLYSGFQGLPSTAHDALDLFQSFKTVRVQFHYGPMDNVERMRYYAKYSRGERNNHEKTMQALGRRQGLEIGPDLTITQTACYYWDGSPKKSLKFWGDEPDDNDYGLGKWTLKTGRVWPIRAT